MVTSKKIFYFTLNDSLCRPFRFNFTLGRPRVVAFLLLLGRPRVVALLSGLRRWRFRQIKGDHLGSPLRGGRKLAFVIDRVMMVIVTRV
jgi:hypothetical protein